MMSRIVSVDIGGTYIRIGSFDDDSRLQNVEKTLTAKIMGDNTAQRLCEIFNDYIQRNAPECNVISIGLPSTLSKDRSQIISSPNIKGLNDIKFKRLIENQLNIKTYIEKDACMLLHNDLHVNDLSNQGVVIGIYFGTGIGNIIMINGSPIIGKDGVAGELGHIPMIGKTEKCSCGLYGCLELYGSGKALEKIKNDNFSDCDIKDIFEKHSDECVLSRFIENMSIAVAIEINILNPDVLVLGGGVIGMTSFPYEKLLQEIRRRVRTPLPKENLQIIKSDVSSPFGGVNGAALYAKKMMEREYDNSLCQ